MIFFLLNLLFVSSQQISAQLNVQTLQNYYREGSFLKVIELVPQTIQTEKDSETLQMILRLAEDCAVLRIHNPSVLLLIYSEFLKRPLTPHLKKSVQAKLSVSKKLIHLAQKRPNDLFNELTRLYLNIKNLNPQDPTSKQEAYLIFISGYLLKLFENEKSFDKKSDLIYLLSESLGPVFSGEDEKYLELFITEFPQDPRAPKAYQTLEEKIKLSYQVNTETKDLPEFEKSRLIKLQSKIKNVK